MNVDFMYYQLLHLKLHTVMENAGIPQLNNKDLYPIFYLKPPLPEQEKIASILSNVDKKIEKEKQFKKQAQSYHRALMQKLLTGEKRVKF